MILEGYMLWFVCAILTIAGLLFQKFIDFCNRVVIQQHGDDFKIKAGEFFMRSDFCWDRGEANAISFKTLDEAKQFYALSKELPVERKIIHEI